ncbi:MAG: hypothetical protein LBO04_03525 [Spirochaetaceae bacterium]|nr:hypothetical protein [Spirochaetaceae bacterium]
MIRDKRAGQNMNNVSEKTAAAMCKETGAALAFAGEVRSITDRAGRISMRMSLPGSKTWKTTEFCGTGRKL